MPYPDHDDLHQRIDGLLDAVSRAWSQHAPTGEELDWPRFHQDTAALLACINEHGRQHLRFLVEFLPRDPGGPPGLAVAARARSFPPAITRMPQPPGLPLRSNRRGTP